MRIALMVDSLLLRKSLENFLGEYIVSYSSCDFVISDKKISIDRPYFSISSSYNPTGELKKPFSRAQLFLFVNRFYKSLNITAQPQIPQAPQVSVEVKRADFDDLKYEVIKLTERFATQLIKTIREHYEKRD